MSTTESTEALAKSVAKPDASEVIATTSVDSESSAKMGVESESPVEEASGMMDRLDNADQVLDVALCSEQAKENEQRAALDTTTEGNTATVDAMNSTFLSSEIKQEEVAQNTVNKSHRIDKKLEELVEDKSNALKEEKDSQTETDETVDATENKVQENKTTPAITSVSSSKRSRPSFKYDPKKITLRFLFANKDGLAVTIECNPSDTIGDVKGALISAWPEGVPPCASGESLRLVCMGKGFLMPDARTLEDIQIPVFKTHPTPINVSIKPNMEAQGDSKDRKIANGSTISDSVRNAQNTMNTPQTNSGCPCSIL